MSRNSNGWGLSTLLLMIGVIILALLTATFFTIRINALLGKNNNESEERIKKVVNENYYIGKMNEVTLAANKYIDDYDLDLSFGTIKIDLNELVKTKYVSVIKDSITNNKCEGYAEAYINTNGVKKVNSYIKCDSYTTPNYRD